MADPYGEMLAFVRVVDHGSFTAAARSLGLSTAMVSRQVAALENRLGVRLLDRNTRRSAPTEAGRSHHARCTDVLAALAEAEAELMHQSAEVSGLLRVSMPAEFAAPHLAGLLAAFVRRHPRLRLDLVLTHRVVDLVEEGIDIAVRFVRRYDAALHGRRLATTRMVLAAAPAWLAAQPRRPRHPDELQGAPGLLYGAPEPWTDFAWQRPGPDGPATGVLRLAPAVVASSSEMICRLACQGAGPAILATLDAGAALGRGELVELCPGFDFGALGIYAVYPHRRHMPAKVRALVDELAAALGGDPEADPFVGGLVGGAPT